MAAWPIVIGCQRAGRHGRPKVGAADADVDYIGDVTTSHLIGKAAHPRQRVTHLRHDIFARDFYRPAIEIAQRSVQHRAALGLIDRRAREHRIAPLGDFGVFDHLQQCRAGLGVDIRLGVVEQHMLRTQREVLGPVRVIEQCRDLAVCHGTLPLLKVLPNVHHAAQ